MTEEMGQDSSAGGRLSTAPSADHIWIANLKKVDPEGSTKVRTKVFHIFWKDMLIRKNHYMATILEVFLPILLIILANIFIKRSPQPPKSDLIVFNKYENNKCAPSSDIIDNIIYDPPDDFAKDLMKKAICYAGYSESVLKAQKIDEKKSGFDIGVEFNMGTGSESPPKVLDYTLYPSDKIWAEMASESKHSYNSDMKYSSPLLFRVVMLQRGIDAAFLSLNSVEAPEMEVDNTTLHNSTPSLFSLAVYLALFLAFTLMVSPIVSRIVHEKASGSKELMLMMGIARWELWVSKIMDITLFILIIVSGMVLFLYVPLTENSDHLDRDPFVFWIFTIYGLIGVMFFLFFMSCLFSNPTIAVYVTQIAWLVSFIIFYMLSDIIQLPKVFTVFKLFLPHIALMEGVKLLILFDTYGKPVTLTENLSESNDNPTLLLILTMITVDIIICIILTWYLDRVRPGKYGVPLPYNFCFKKSYWNPSRVTPLSSRPASSRNPSLANFEPVPKDLKVGVSLQNVTKTFGFYKNNEKIAVDNVTINFYRGEISGLLGHNGAGKTTTFSMISGLSYPTSGKIIINGYDLAVNIDKARKSLGLCPQQDMLFDDLTPFQILKFYGVVKGLKCSEAKSEGNKLIKELKLSRVRNTRCGKLSGGQKRKVSLAIAMIGGSEIVLLDEPSSGLDPEIRREIWKILLALRGARTIVLTTHFLEEADALCDRIAIMDHGKVKCYGTPMYLKSKFGKGYIVSVVVLNMSKVRDIISFVKQNTGGKFKSQNVRTLTFEIPESESKNFPTLLSGLEEKQKKNEIASYAISISALEDVFLRISGTHDEGEPPLPPTDKSDFSEEVTPKARRKYLFAFQFWALLIKKWLFFTKSIITFMMFCILALLFLIIVIAFAENKSNSSSSNPALCPLSLSQHSSSIVLFTNIQEEEVKKKFVNFVESYSCDAEEVKDIRSSLQEYFKNDFKIYGSKIVLGVDYSPKLKVFYNEFAKFMLPISLNFIHNFLLQPKEVEIITTLNVDYANRNLLASTATAPTCRMTTMADYCGTQTIFYLIGPLKENMSGAKEIQLMITSATLYWLSHYLFDILTFLIYILIVFLGLGLSLNDKFMFENAGIALGTFFLWGSGLIFINYFISSTIRNTAGAFILCLTFYLLASFLIYQAIIFELIPNSLRFLHPSCIEKLGLNDLCAGRSTSFGWELLLFDIVIFVLLILKDSQILSRFFFSLCSKVSRVNYGKTDNIDDFVKLEEERVHNLIQKKSTESVLIADNIKRWFCLRCRHFPAVKGVTFSVKKGECFGLLGVNGAGKTSTFRMLMGSLPTAGGHIYICSQKLNICNRQKYLFSVGYCPQYEGLIYSFTSRELLIFFGRLKGIPEKELKSVVHSWLERVNLLEYENRKCGTYSGGNKRKLSTAIAMIGDPPLIFLDEPTSGVDPVARRALWNVVEHTLKEGQSVVLTSHSMDECEALCSRIAIMVTGRFRCIGEITTLKNKFGQGFCIEIKVSPDAKRNNVESLKRAIVQNFQPGCSLVSEHLTIIQYHIKNKNLTWADIFGKLQNLKKNYSIIESYAASSTTLEQVLIHFAKN